MTHTANGDDGYENLGVTVIVYDRTTNRVLLGIRKNSYQAGTYACPGGRIERSEPLERTAERELLEETGLTARHLTFAGTVREFQGTYNFIHFTFVCDAWSGSVTTREPDKCAGWAWYPPDRLPEPMLRGHAAGIRLYTEPVKIYLADITGSEQ